MDKKTRENVEKLLGRNVKNLSLNYIKKLLDKKVKDLLDKSSEDDSKFSEYSKAERVRSAFQQEYNKLKNGKNENNQN